MRALLLDNLGLKLVSLVLGFSLWYIVAGEQGAEIALSVPLELRNVPEGFEVVEESVQQVDVRLRGSTEILRSLSPADVQVGVDLSMVKPGPQTIYLSPENVRVPFGARVMRVSPASVNLELDRAGERKVQVVPRVVGAPASGFELVNVVIEPAAVEVAGPASRLETLEQITTEPISVEGLRDRFTQSAQLQVEDPYVRLLGGREVEVTLDVREERLRRRFSGVAILVRPSSAKTRIQPDSLVVLVEGPRSLVEKARAEDIEVRVELGGLDPGSHQVSPEVRFRRPEFAEVKILSIEPEKIRVRLLAAGGS